MTLYCIEKKILYQTAEYHNALFVGYDKEGTPRYGALRATRSPYKGDLTGSNKHFSFSMNENPAPEHIHVFESAIDAMSYATMLLLNGRDWKKETFLSLAGVYKTKREKVVPVALERYLKDYPSIKTVHLHLDNDGIGRGAVAGIVSGLQEKYTVLDVRLPSYQSGRLSSNSKVVPAFSLFSKLHFLPPFSLGVFLQLFDPAAVPKLADGRRPLLRAAEDEHVA